MAEISSSEMIGHFKQAAAHLTAHKDDINKLNVFPVPDGDTGTNMSLTIQNVVRELDGLSGNITLADITRAVTHGSLMGARGNSGVITSQILRGICEALNESQEFDSQAVAVALTKAVEVAFNAVRRPVEGTILTVLKDMSIRAGLVAAEGADFCECLNQVAEEAFLSVQRTPDLLPVLKENNVVDAGGYGLALLAQGFVASVLGKPLAKTSVDMPVAGVVDAPKVAIEQINDWEGSEYLYCTEFLLKSDHLDVPATKEFLASLGDCELLVGTHPDFKIHVHTDVPGTVLTYMTERGQVSEVHVHNMRLQSAERSSSLAAAESESVGQGAKGVTDGVGEDASGRGYVAVASGDGLVKILESLGVDVVVSGGQTMNPSTAELLDAIELVNAEEVVVFPNNKNIIMAANAAADLSKKHVEVVPTKSVPASFSALFLADPGEPLESQVESMREVIEGVRSAEITTAVKDAKSADGEPISVGDIIGILDDSIVFVGRDINQIAMSLVGLLAKGNPDTLTILAGADYQQSDFDALVSQIEDNYPDLELDSHRGDQPLYPLIIAAE
ncbi:MAG: DAK2 domain-containing protein [Coriobacteriales bacterium]|nr:DAK2 domain-containing protein [Coriobacteriales bacterium]